ncbi:HYC_CC_PP family protein [Haliscomenobacter hydrossis]|uniref:Uncharacterized protein n=1 Tax=Haliscomenobacter hydrossis (strain ATCC 27775 / DSM 1100 / LMG 10767 / O) TaxID=760192 RepID=F4L3W9_HALH1|nr:hypothetical protein [Haliscomenobacter hydrossis]AEE49686.1 hypothetical protein Halhy_1800 [Haliscomenobacter hydrossis DSM 1100]
MLKTLHLILALNVLLSSTGLTVFEHLCQMKGRTVSIFTQPKGCCKLKKSDKPSCCLHEEEPQDESLSRKPCCQDKSQLLKSNIDGAVQKIALHDFNFQALIIQVLPFQSMTFDVIPSSQKALRFYLYKPPPKVTDIRVFIQSFLC